MASPQGGTDYLVPCISVCWASVVCFQSLDGQSGERNARIVTNLWLPVALKRRCGFLSYERDPNGAHSLHQRPFSTHGAARHQALATMLGLEDGGANNFGQAFHSDLAAAEVAAEYGYNESLM